MRFKLLNRMLSDYFSGRYKRIPWSTIAMAAAAAGYVVLPFDGIPDFLGPLGFTDDVAVITMAFKAIGEDLHQYARDQGLDPREHGL